MAAVKHVTHEEPVGAAVAAQVPLMVSQGAADALAEVCARLRENPRLYRDIELYLMKIQRGTTGLLTELLAALVGNLD